jgi:hypothetical protein
MDRAFRIRQHGQDNRDRRAAGKVLRQASWKGQPRQESREKPAGKDSQDITTME